MLLWVASLGGLTLIIGTVVALVLSMGRAERRARRSLYRSLGLAETTVEYLMARNRDVLSELTYVRHQGEDAVEKALDLAASRTRNATLLRAGLKSERPTIDPVIGDHAIPPTDNHTRH